MTAPERVNLYRDTYGIDPDTGNPLPGEGPTEYVRADLYDAAVAERDEAQRERDEARGTNERWERVSALSDYVRLDRMWQALVLERDAFRRELRAAENERDEAKRLLAEAVDARDEAMREAETLERDRDEARAEVAKLQRAMSAIQERECCMGDTPGVYECDVRRPCLGCTMRAAEKKRDAARAEVERLDAVNARLAKDISELRMLAERMSGYLP